MARRCARLACGEPAVASVLFVNETSRIEVIDLADATAGIPVCAGHARRLTPPIGWDLVDLRSPARGVDRWVTPSPELTGLPVLRS